MVRRGHLCGMKMSWMPVLLVGALLVGGCDGSSGGSAPSAPPPPSAAPTPSASAAKPAPSPAQRSEREVVFHLSRPLTNLARVSLVVGTVELEAELCTTISEVSTGQMFRESIGPNDAMLFVFASGDRRSFYMKNVKFPIAAAYIDTEGVVDEIVQLKAMQPEPVPSRSENIQFVLETAPDWFERNKIAPGTRVMTTNGTLKAVLARRARLP